jgi:ketosteroid isomerase-like protein
LRRELDLLDETFTTYHETWEPRSVRLFGELAVVFGEFKMTSVFRKGGRRVNGRFWGTFVLRKQEGGWRFVHIAFVRAAQPRAAATASDTSDVKGPPNHRIDTDGE